MSLYSSDLEFMIFPSKRTDLGRDRSVAVMCGLRCRRRNLATVSANSPLRPIGVRYRSHFRLEGQGTGVFNARAVKISEKNNRSDESSCTENSRRKLMRKHKYTAELTIFCLVLTIASVSQAVPLPPVIAEAQATAMTPGEDAGTVTDTGQSTASAANDASGSGLADAFATATVGGTARAFSLVNSASGLAEASNATANARWVAHVQTGGSDPLSPIDIDLDLSVDGTLTYSNNNTNVELNDLLSSVTFRMTLHDMASGAISVFDGSADLTGISRTDSPILVRSGDWADGARDGDFIEQDCSPFSCEFDVNALIRVDDALTVGFGEVFAVEVELGTKAFQAQGRETGAVSDFANSASVSLSTDTPGITFTLVPEPTSAMLLVLGAIFALGTGRDGVDR